MQKKKNTIEVSVLTVITKRWRECKNNDNSWVAPGSKG